MLCFGPKYVSRTVNQLSSVWNEGISKDIPYLFGFLMDGNFNLKALILKMTRDMTKEMKTKGMPY